MSDIARRNVGIIVEWQAVDNPWIDHRWRVVGVLPSAPEVQPWTCLADEGRVRRYYAGAAELALFPRETETLAHNLAGETPAVYVFLRFQTSAPGVALLGATVCVGEAHAHVDSGSDLVEAVPMPDEVAAWVSAFVAHHHVDQPAYRRRRESAR